jgi:plasmid stabilization system protein ParE
MSFTVEWSRRALRDLHAIHAYIATDSPRAAERIAAELETVADSLAEMPGRGRRVGAEIRELVAGQCLLRYLIRGETVAIVRVKHAAQLR